jgi:hypothetical protein
MRSQGVGELGEEDGRLRQGHTRFLRMAAIVEAHADDFLGAKNRGRVLDGRFIQEPTRLGVSHCILDKMMQTLHAPPPFAEEFGQGAGSIDSAGKRRGVDCACQIEDATPGSDANAGMVSDGLGIDEV